MIPRTISELLTLEALRRLAGSRSFERGEEYFEVGAVGALQWDEMSVRAGVQGTDRYRVLLEVSSGKLVGSCSCPVGRDGLFCKHCVAVGLVWLASSSGDDDRAVLTRSELRSHLTALGAEALADLLVQHALGDERLHARLLALTARAGRHSPDFPQLAHAFDVAVDPGGFVSWNEAHGFADGLEEVIDAAEGQLESDNSADIVAFCERALRRVEEAFGYVDDSDGGLGEVKERLEQLHLAACREAHPIPVSSPSASSAWSSRASGRPFTARWNATPTYSAIEESPDTVSWSRRPGNACRTAGPGARSAATRLSGNRPSRLLRDRRRAPM